MNNLQKILSNMPEERIALFTRRFFTYVKYSSGVGSVCGLSVSIAVIADMNKYNRTYTTNIGLPMVGIIGGGMLGPFVPTIAIFGPVTYLFGADTAGTIAKSALAAVLAVGVSSDKKK
jgi:hypothetical protein